MKQDFIKNPAIEKEMPPPGHDFYKPGMEVQNPEYHEPEEVKKAREEAERLANPRSHVNPDENASSTSRYKCDVCGYECATVKGMEKHISKKHQSSGKEKEVGPENEK